MNSSASIQPVAGASVEIGFYPSIDNTGTLRLKSTLKSVDQGQYVAVVVGVGAALALIGVTAWIGILIDVALAGLLMYKLPIKLKEEIAKYMGSKEWKLLESLPLVDPAKQWHLAAPFDVHSKSLLASIDVGG